VFILNNLVSFPDPSPDLTCVLGENSHRSDKVVNKLVSLMRNNGYGLPASNLEACGNHEFWVQCEDCGHKWSVTRTCDLRVCPKCEGSRKSRVINKYKESVLSKMDKRNIRFITLTKKNKQSLKPEHIKEIRSDFNKLLRKQLNPDNNSKATFKSKLHGGIYAIEINHTKNGWNIHMHVFYEGFYIDQSNLSRAWEDITGNPIVDIRKINDEESALLDVCKYVAKKPFVRDKYTDKEGNTHLEDISINKEAKRLFEYFEATYKTHMVQVFGKFHHADSSCSTTISVSVPKVTCPECGSNNIISEFQIPELFDPPDKKTRSQKIRSWKYQKSQSGLEVFIQK